MFRDLKNNVNLAKDEILNNQRYCEAPLPTAVYILYNIYILYRPVNKTFKPQQVCFPALLIWLVETQHQDEIIEMAVVKV